MLEGKVKTTKTNKQDQLQMTYRGKGLHEPQIG